MKMYNFYNVWLLTLVVACSARPDLDALVDSIRRSRREQPVCGLDVVFVLDDSSSIWGQDFDKEKEFVSEIIDKIDVGPNGSHVGIMAFSEEVQANYIALGQYVRQPDRIGQIVSDMRHRAGLQTNTDKALKELREMFANARPNVPNVGVIITDGNSTRMGETRKEAALTRAAGITLFAIGVGDQYNYQELHDIASSPQNIMEVERFGDLHDHLEELSQQLCQGCFAPMDVLFSAPDEAGIDDTARTLTFIKDVIENLNIGPHSTQVGLTPRLGDEKDGITLNEFGAVNLLENAIDMRELDATQLSRQLHYIMRGGFSRGGRPKAKKVGILVVDNMSENYQETVLLADELKRSGVTLMTIGVGAHFNSEELQNVASVESYKTFYTARSYTDLRRLSVDLAENLCESLTPGEL